MQQPVIARLERGEQPPSLATLARITAGTAIAFHLDVRDGAVALTALTERAAHCAAMTHGEARNGLR
jgi:predicted transcriptional regulator